MPSRVFYQVPYLPRRCIEPGRGGIEQAPRLMLIGRVLTIAYRLPLPIIGSGGTADEVVQADGFGFRPSVRTFVTARPSTPDKEQDGLGLNEYFSIYNWQPPI